MAVAKSGYLFFVTLENEQLLVNDTLPFAVRYRPDIHIFVTSSRNDQFIILPSKAAILDLGSWSVVFKKMWIMPIFGCQSHLSHVG